MRVLVIDDVRVMGFECEYARNLEEAHSKLFGSAGEGLAWDEVWWDHDLGAETIRPLIEQIERNHALYEPYFIPRIGRCVVHTSNPAGRNWIIAGLRNAGYTVEITNPPVIGHLEGAE